MDTNISEDELEVFLKEAGVLDAPAINSSKKEESVEKLLEEIIDSIQTAVPLQERAPPLSERSKSFKFSYLPLFISIAFLGGVLFGTLFGFYCGKNQKIEHTHPNFEEINAKIIQLLRQIQEICDKISPTIPIEEIIEPLTLPNEIPNLAPERVM